MGVKELTVVMDLAREVGILLARRFEHDLEDRQRPSTGEFVRTTSRTLEPLVSLCDARYTLPNEPFPISLPRV